MAPARMEAKFYPMALNSSWVVGSGGAFGTSPVYQNVGPLIQMGTDASQRVGREVFVKSLEFNGTLEGGQSNLATDDNHNTVRFIVCTGTPSSLGSSISSNFSVSYYLNQRGLPGLERVLYDQTWELMSPGRDSTGYMPALAKFKVRVPINQKLTWTGSSGNATFRDIYFAAVSDSSAAPNPGFTYGYVTVNFVDA